MGYVTGSVSDVHTLLQELRLELEAEGWTIHRNRSVADGREISAEPPSSPLVFHWRSDNTTGSGTNFPPPRLYLTAGTSFDGNEGWSTQPGIPQSPEDHFTEEWNGPITEYHFFVTAEYAHVVARSGSGYWRHCLAGIAENVSSAPVAYIQGVLWSRHSNDADHHNDSAHARMWDRQYFGRTGPNWVWSDGSGSPVWYWMSYRDGNPSVRSAFRAAGDNNDDQLLGRLWGRGTNAFNSITPLLPVPLFAQDGTIYCILGWVKDHRVVNIQELSPGQIIAVGTDEWLVFPAINKREDSQNDGIPASRWFGYAYKRSL